MLHARRRRLAGLASREAEGESLWSEEFPKALRVRLVHLIHDQQKWEEFAAGARYLVLRDEGMFFLLNANYDPWYDYEHYLLGCSDDMMPTVIEAFAMALGDDGFQDAIRRWGQAGPFTQMVNDLLREYRISYELNGGEMIPFASRELHVEVVEPALRLLAASPEWDEVESAYRKALEELSAGDPSDAITDAGTALQAALTLLGCDGNKLGPLIRSARAKKILSAHDGPMLDAIERIASWVSADRSNNGDAHKASGASADDAWLIVHVVGALLVRLGKGTARPGN